MSTLIVDASGPTRTKLKNKYLPLIDPRNRTAVEADLAAYFGPRAEKYLSHYRRMVDEGKVTIWSWHWPFLLTGGFVWLFYRRVWDMAAFMLLLPLFLLALQGLGLPVGWDMLLLVLTAQAKNMYVLNGFKQILRAENKGLVGEPRKSFLRGKGGTSWIAAKLSGVWLAFLLIVMIASLAKHTSDGGAIPARSASAVDATVQLRH